LNDYFDVVDKQLHEVSSNGDKLTLYTAFQYILNDGETAAKSAKSAERLAFVLGNCKVFYGLGAIWIELGGSLYTSPENYVEHLSLDAGAPARTALRALNKQFAPTAVPNKTPPSKETTSTPFPSASPSTHRTTTPPSSEGAPFSSSASSATPSALYVVTPATILPLSSSSSSSSPSPPPILPFLLKECRTWSNSDVADWLSSLDLSDCGPPFTLNEIDGAGLLDLSNDDLDYLKVKVLKHRNFFMCGVRSQE
jgi:hypothetical protein